MYDTNDTQEVARELKDHVDTLSMEADDHGDRKDAKLLNDLGNLLEWYAEESGHAGKFAEDSPKYEDED